METNNENHVSGAVAGIVMLAAVFTTYTTYSYYQEDKLATNSESDQASLEQTASALVSLRMKAVETATGTPATTTDSNPKVKTKKIELE